MATCVTSQDLQLALEDLATQLGISVQELLTSYATTDYVDGKVAGLTTQFSNLTTFESTDVALLSGKIDQINQLIANLPADISQTILTQLSTLNAEMTAVQSAQASQGIAIAANTADIVNMKNELATHDNEINILKADELTEGSVKKTVKQSVGDLTKLHTTDKSNAVNAINEVLDDVNTVNAKAESDAQIAITAANNAQTTASAALAEANATKAEADATKVEADANAAAIAKLNGDVNTTGSVLNTVESYVMEVQSATCLQTGIINGKAAANKFRAVFGQAAIDTGTGTTGGNGGL